MSRKGAGLIHFYGLAAVVHRFTLVGEALMTAELGSLREAAVAALTPGDTQTDKNTVSLRVHVLRSSENKQHADVPRL